MYKTSYNNYKNNFLPFLISNQINSDRVIKNRNLNDIQQKEFSRNKKFLVNEMTNNKIKLYKKINLFKTNKFPLYFTNNNNNFLIHKNYDIKKLNNDFFSLSLNMNNTTDKTNTLHFNKEIINSSDENKINNTDKNKIILDLNRSDSFKKYNSLYLFENLLNQISFEQKKKDTKPKFYRNKLNKFKFSDYFLKSRDEKIGAKRIIKHYLKQKDESFSPKSQRKIHHYNGKYDYNYVMCPQLKILYGDNPSFNNKLNEIKKNDYIAMKKDFKINEYQDLLMKLCENKISEKNMNKLKKDFGIFNEKNYGMKIPKGRYINLANKLKDHLSVFAFENLKKMDRNYTKYYSTDKNGNTEIKKKEKDKINEEENKLIIKKIRIKKGKRNKI